MNKKWLLAIILVLTISAVGVIIISKIKNTYNDYVLSESDWNKIISNRDESTSINLKNIEFNNNDLLIDENNNTIYYSIVDTNNKYNPSVEYTSKDNIKLAINKKITDELLDKEEQLELMIYDDNNYHIYSLYATTYPILNLNYKNDKDLSNKKQLVDLYIFDNHKDAFQRVVKSDARFEIVEENSEYNFSLTKQSLGRNKRENNISIFGMPKQDDYKLVKVEEKEADKKYVLFFMNNKSMGLYSLEHKEGRRLKDIEQKK